ncbi:hypothetical protein GmHk_10G028239 [Glycine max]|nr:hypothetical protein GmHk_10G028239 [Glycine max]
MNSTSFQSSKNQKTLESFWHKEEEEVQRDSRLVKDCMNILMTAEWRWKNDDWRRHFKEKMSQEEAHHHRKPWIKA